MRNYSCENGFALILVLKQRLKRTRKWPIKEKLSLVACVAGGISRASAFFCSEAVNASGEAVAS